MKTSTTMNIKTRLDVDSNFIIEEGIEVNSSGGITSKSNEVIIRPEQANKKFEIDSDRHNSILCDSYGDFNTIKTEPVGYTNINIQDTKGQNDDKMEVQREPFINDFLKIEIKEELDDNSYGDWLCQEALISSEFCKDDPLDMKSDLYGGDNLDKYKLPNIIGLVNNICIPSTYNSEECLLCDICNKIFQYASSLKVHKENCSGLHQKTKPDFQCSSCHIIFHDSKELKVHRLQVHKLTFACAFCDYQAATKKAIDLHKVVIHKGFRFSCCQKVKGSLENHLKTRHGGGEYTHANTVSVATELLYL